jgi:SlyX protein
VTKKLEERVTALEAALAHQEAAVQDLSEMIARQWDIIDLLKRDNARFKEAIATLDSRTRPNPEDEPPPPHY